MVSIYTYQNSLYKLQMNGLQLRKFMEWSAAFFKTWEPQDVTIAFDSSVRYYLYDAFAGVKYDLDISKEPGNRIRNLTWMKYLGGAYKGASEADNMQDGYTSSGLICPNAASAFSPRHTSGGLHDLTRSYGIPAHDFAIGAWASDSSDKILAWKLPRVVEPGTRIGFIDSCDWAVYRKGDDPSTYLKVNEYGYWDASPAASNYVAYRHGGNNLANVCYLDGHVNTEQAATLKNAEKSFKSFYKKY